jgi:hypothetical protein
LPPGRKSGAILSIGNAQNNPAATLPLIPPQQIELRHQPRRPVPHSHEARPPAGADPCACDLSGQRQPRAENSGSGGRPVPRLHSSKRRCETIAMKNDDVCPNRRGAPAGELRPSSHSTFRARARSRCHPCQRESSPHEAVLSELSAGLPGGVVQSQAGTVGRYGERSAGLPGGVRQPQDGNSIRY